MNKHEFLFALHQMLKPRGYLEIGVQHGTSLRLATCSALGIDPSPLVGPVGDRVDVITATSDDFFAQVEDYSELPGLPAVDLAFIDGMHLVENALRDFANIERWSHRTTVVVFDDVLPRNQVEGSREPNPGDWAGDVWKVHPILRALRPDLSLHLVDTEPTGVLVATALDPASTVLADNEESVNVKWAQDMPVPDDVFQRAYAVPPELALGALGEWIR